LDYQLLGGSIKGFMHQFLLLCFGFMLDLEEEDLMVRQFENAFHLLQLARKDVTDIKRKICMFNSFCN
jgi:hypothetical protein